MRSVINRFAKKSGAADADLQGVEMRTTERDEGRESGGALRNARRWYRPMVARDTTEEYRQATPLELFFDLCFVVAVAFAGIGLHDQIVEGHIESGVIRFLLVFFGIWWAWMNFTWFASAYDTDDVPYRIATFVQMAGVLILAAGVRRVYEDADFTITVAGYVVMRMAIVPQWIRAGFTDPARRVTAWRYAAGIAIVQIGWAALLLASGGLYFAVFVTFAAIELLIPVWAESAGAT